MKVGIILVIVAWAIFVVLSFVSRLSKKKLFNFVMDDLLDYHVTDSFKSDAKQLAFRLILAFSFLLYAIGVIVFVLNLNCFPADFNVLMKLFVAFFGGLISGMILTATANIIAIAVPVILLTIVALPLMFIDWLRGE